MKERPWHSRGQSKRTGAVAIKLGMLGEYDSWGCRHALTVLLVHANHVTQVKTDAGEGYTALQVGAGEAKPKRVTKQLLGHLAKAGLACGASSEDAIGTPPKRKLWEFRVTPDAVVPPGTKISAAHFVPGQRVDVCGTSKGKGFQGGMKRHGFSGQRATHGVSKTRRAIGSTGQCQTPGRVFKGKKMPGHMGVDRVTVQSLVVYKVDAARDLVYVKGHVPGNNGGWVRISDATKGALFDAPEKLALAPPFPTLSEEALAAALAEGDAVVECPPAATDPLIPDPKWNDMAY